MKILVVVDGSSYSKACIKIIEDLKLPAGTEVNILTVVPEPTFLGGITLDVIRGTSQARKKAREEQQEKALELVRLMSRTLDEDTLKIETMVRQGNPAEVIMFEAEQQNASLIVMGAKGLTDPLNFRLGSVALTLMKHSSKNVLIVRPKSLSVSQTSNKKGKVTGISRVLLATDGSKYADNTANFLLDLPLPRQTEVIVVTALQSHVEGWIASPTLNFQMNQEIIARLHAAEKDEARKLTIKVETKFRQKGYKTSSVVYKGSAGQSILTAAKEYNTDIIAVGNKGLSGIESFLIGSVAERLARYANCSVLIGKG